MGLNLSARSESCFEDDLALKYAEDSIAPDYVIGARYIDKWYKIGLSASGEAKSDIYKLTSRFTRIVRAPSGQVYIMYNAGVISLYLYKWSYPYVQGERDPDARNLNVCHSLSDPNTANWLKNHLDKHFMQ